MPGASPGWADRYVAERMRGTGCNVGGEQSGHMILTDFATIRPNFDTFVLDLLAPSLEGQNSGLGRLSGLAATSNEI